MAASHSAFVGNSVHFLLDGLDMAEVAKKGQRTGSGGRTSVSITTSELRYVFRHWNTLKGVVKFYVNFTQVPAPWEEDWTLATIPNCAPNPITAELVEWGNYYTARLEKYNGKLPDKDLV